MGPLVIFEAPTVLAGRSQRPKAEAQIEGGITHPIATCGCIGIRGFPKIRGPILGVLVIRIIVY